MKWAWGVDLKGHSWPLGSRTGHGVGDRQSCLSLFGEHAAVLWGSPHRRAGEWGGATEILTGLLSPGVFLLCMQLVVPKEGMHQSLEKSAVA